MDTSHCGTYARFSIVHAARDDVDTDEEAPEPASMWMKVKCRQCGSEWAM
jgi:hypothetical protein